MTNTFLLYLIRHGESANNALPEAQRVSDPALTELGMAQAEKLGQRFHQHVAAGNKIDLILTSPFLRTMQTIRPTAKLLNMNPQIRTQIYEAGGCFDGYRPGELKGKPGMTHQEISTQFPEMLIPTDIDHQGWYKRTSFENWEEATKRAEQQANLLKNEFIGSNKSIICTVHADLIGLMMAVFCEHDLSMANTTVSNTSVTLLSFKANATNTPDVISFNDASHLNPDEISH